MKIAYLSLSILFTTTAHAMNHELQAELSRVHEDKKVKPYIEKLSEILFPQLPAEMNSIIIQHLIYTICENQDLRKFACFHRSSHQMLHILREIRKDLLLKHLCKYITNDSLCYTMYTKVPIYPTRYIETLIKINKNRASMTWNQYGDTLAFYGRAKKKRTKYIYKVTPSDIYNVRYPYKQLNDNDLFFTGYNTLVETHYTPDEHTVNIRVINDGRDNCCNINCPTNQPFLPDYYRKIFQLMDTTSYVNIIEKTEAKKNPWTIQSFIAFSNLNKHLPLSHPLDRYIKNKLLSKDPIERAFLYYQGGNSQAALNLLSRQLPVETKKDDTFFIEKACPRGYIEWVQTDLINAMKQCSAVNKLGPLKNVLKNIQITIFDNNISTIRCNNPDNENEAIMHIINSIGYTQTNIDAKEKCIDTIYYNYACNPYAAYSAYLLKNNDSTHRILLFDNKNNKFDREISFLDKNQPEAISTQCKLESFFHAKSQGYYYTNAKDYLIVTMQRNPTSIPNISYLPICRRYNLQKLQKASQTQAIPYKTIYKIN